MTLIRHPNHFVEIYPQITGPSGSIRYSILRVNLLENENQKNFEKSIECLGTQYVHHNTIEMHICMRRKQSNWCTHCGCEIPKQVYAQYTFSPIGQLLGQNGWANSFWLLTL